MMSTKPGVFEIRHSGPALERDDVLTAVEPRPAGGARVFWHFVRRDGTEGQAIRVFAGADLDDFIAALQYCRGPR